MALVVLSEDPEYFVTTIRHFLNRPPFSVLAPKPEYTMLGRTYAQGYEPDLEDALIARPRSRIFDAELRWAVWYPLRRAGSFERLSADEQRIILLEHSGIGRAFGKAGLGHDIRLACHGLDKNDNDFVIGLLGPRLYPLSAIVQRMRKTKQTSLHIEHMGPFFVGQSGLARQYSSYNRGLRSPDDPPPTGTSEQRSKSWQTSIWASISNSCGTTTNRSSGASRRPLRWATIMSNRWSIGAANC